MHLHDGLGYAELTLEALQLLQLAAINYFFEAINSGVESR